MTPTEVNEQQLLQTLGALLGDVLGREPVELTSTTRREDVRDWDSFSYINFIVAVEARLGVRFAVADVESFADVGAIVRRTQELLARKAGG